MVKKEKPRNIQYSMKNKRNKRNKKNKRSNKRSNKRLNKRSNKRLNKRLKQYSRKRSKKYKKQYGGATFSDQSNLEAQVTWLDSKYNLKCVNPPSGEAPPNITFNDLVHGNEVYSLWSSSRYSCPLGEGSFAVVVSVQNKSEGNMCREEAMKYQKPETDNDNVVVKNEIEIIKKLREISNWENIVEFYDIFSLQGNRWIFTMESMGNDLNIHLLSNNKLDGKNHKIPILSPIIRLKFIQSMINGIHVLHTHGIFHQDIKPENLLLNTARDVLKFTDFGLSAYNANSRLDGKGFQGSPTYMSPSIVNYYRTRKNGQSVTEKYYNLKEIRKQRKQRETQEEVEENDEHREAEEKALLNQYREVVKKANKAVYDRHTNDLWGLMIIIFTLFDMDWWGFTVLENQSDRDKLFHKISLMSDKEVFESSVKIPWISQVEGVKELDGPDELINKLFVEGVKELYGPDELINKLFEFTMEVQPATTLEEGKSSNWIPIMTRKLSELNRIIDARKDSHTVRCGC
jgi:serine/threonine protein kinase